MLDLYKEGLIISLHPSIGKYVVEFVCIYKGIFFGGEVAKRLHLITRGEDWGAPRYPKKGLCNI